METKNVVISSINNVNNANVEQSGDFLVRNRMSASALKEMTGASIDFVANPKREGHVFFACGTAVPYGYVSPQVIEKFNNKTLKLDDMQFAECSNDNGETWVPCLMMKANNNIVGSF